MIAPSRAVHTLALTILIGSAALFTACGKPEKPSELTEIEALWQDPATRKVKDIPGAERYYREARQFRYDAGEAYDKREVALAREYSIWSKVRYRTALAIARQFAAKERLDAANARVAQRNPELTAINQERNKLMTEVADLERQVAMARRQREDRDKRFATSTQNTTSTTYTTNPQRQSELATRLQRLDEARQAALAVKADLHAPALYNRANNIYNSIQKQRSQQPTPYDQLLADSETARLAFDQATLDARPGFKEDLAKQDPAARRDALRTAAQNVLGLGGALIEGEAVRLIVAEAYDQGATTVSASQRASLDAVIKIAGDFDEYSISIEAYTGPGDATENLGTTQLRARNIENALLAAGIPQSRIVSSRGQGQENIRFPDQRARNERFEIIFRR